MQENLQITKTNIRYIIRSSRLVSIILQSFFFGFWLLFYVLQIIVYITMLLVRQHYLFFLFICYNSIMLRENKL